MQEQFCVALIHSYHIIGIPIDVHNAIDIYVENICFDVHRKGVASERGSQVCWRMGGGWRRWKQKKKKQLFNASNTINTSPHTHNTVTLCLQLLTILYISQKRHFRLVPFDFVSTNAQDCSHPINILLSCVSFFQIYFFFLNVFFALPFFVVCLSGGEMESRIESNDLLFFPNRLLAIL